MPLIDAESETVVLEVLLSSNDVTGLVELGARVVVVVRTTPFDPEGTLLTFTLYEPSHDGVASVTVCTPSVHETTAFRVYELDDVAEAIV